MTIDLITSIKIKMKYIILFIVASITTVIHAQEFYYYQGEKVNLNKLENQYYVEVQDDSKKRFLENNTNEFQQLTKIGAGFAVESAFTKSELSKNPAVKFANPLFLNESNQRFSYYNEILVRLKEDASLAELQKHLANSTWSVCSEYDYGFNVYVLCDQSGSGQDGLQLANQLYESGLYWYAEPNFVAEKPEQYMPNDPQLSQQYSVNNNGSIYGGDNGSSGADMNILDAWDVTTGCSEIIIAIIDDGVNLNHPDLTANLIPGFDALGQGTAGASQNGDTHGTACAGTAAARGDNGIGVAGIAYSCSIMPVRAFASEISTSSLNFALAIDWAWMNGADVLSNSWSWSTSNAISDAIERAVTQGRNGIGCVVLASSGNSNLSNTLAFPARDINVISVGASNMCDERKSAAIDTTGCFDVVVTNLAPDITGGVSCDDDRCWGSNYGNDLDIVAPGISVRTTFGINDYGWFRGTSAACPNAAGVAALILSTNDQLPGIQAKNILLSTARKAGGYTYTIDLTNPFGSWNIEMGHGVVDAHEAVLTALASARLFIQNRVFSVGASSYFQPYEIQAGENVTISQPTGEVIVQNNALVHFNTGKRILLRPGFEAQSGSDFRARILNVDCTVKL